MSKNTIYSPKGFLSKQGILAVRETNQIANYALVKWNDNVKIANQAPADYLPNLKVRFNSSELRQMLDTTRYQTTGNIWITMNSRKTSGFNCRRY